MQRTSHAGFGRNRGLSTAGKSLFYSGTVCELILTAMSSGLVELGYAEEIEDASAPILHADPDWSEWDGGKMGGAPSWLSPKGQPPSDALKCTRCGAQESFLLQVYASRGSDHPG